MPFAGYYSAGYEGPNASADCSISTSGFGAKAELSAGKISSEVGYARAEINPNLTTSATFGMNGIDTRIGGTGASISRKSVDLHTPIGSIGMRFPWC